MLRNVTRERADDTKLLLNEVLSLNAQEYLVQVVSAIESAILNEVLSLNAQECLIIHFIQKIQFVILNEVLSLNAQESESNTEKLNSIGSSMKS